MLILVLLGMYFDAALVFVKTFLLLFRLALAILCPPKFFDLPPSCDKTRRPRLNACLHEDRKVCACLKL